ncbi:WXG100 family type VII secretion target [Streptomyces sp. 6N223]|uniref:WXG100 family type VII secretion target n=1 Tax=Streptomyces sp. 6N223 TaxID=3457412 RepID=UPI003FD1DA92
MTLNVRYGALDLGAEQIRTVTGNLVERLETLQTSLRSVAAGWDGEAMRAFNVNMNAFTQELDKLRIVQTNTGTSVSNARASYQSQDHRNASRIMGA